MGIGRQAARTLIDSVRAGTANRKQLRTQMGDAIDLLRDFADKLDRQEAAALGDFAASKAGQFSTFVDGLAEPPIDQTP